MDIWVTKYLRSRWSNMGVRRRGALLIAFPVICFIASLITVDRMRTDTLKIRDKAEETQLSILEASRLLAVLVNARASVLGYELTGNPIFLKSYSVATVILPKSFNKLEPWSQRYPAEGKLLQEIKILSEKQMNLLTKSLETIENLGTPKGGSRKFKDQVRESQLLMDTLQQRVSEFSTLAERRLSVLNEEVNYGRRLINAFLWSAVFVGALGSGISWYLFCRLERELSKERASLQESKVRIQAVVDNAADGIMTLDSEGNLVSWNPAAARLFGYEGKMVMQVNLRQLIAKPQSEETGDDLNYFLVTLSANLRCCQREAVGLRANGSTFLMDLAISEMQLENERLFIAICRDITERKLADERLRNQARLLDLANDSIIVRDLEDRIGYWNQGARRLYGWRRSEAIGQEVHSLLQTEFPQPKEKIKEVLLQNSHWEGELVHTKKDGTKVTVASSWSLQRDENGQPLAILQINNDMTERKLVQKALTDSKQMLQLVIDNIPQFIVWKDLNGVILGCNENVARLVGLDCPADIVGKTDFDMPVSREEAERYWAHDLQVMETNTPEYHIVGFLSLAGSNSKQIWVDANKIPLTDGAGKVVGILSTFEDITERKRAEAALAESEQRFRATFEQAAVGMGQATLDGRWMVVNQKLCEIVGYTREELLELSFQDISHPDDLEADLEGLRQLLAGKIETYSMEKRYIRSDGSQVWANLTVSLLHDASGGQSLMRVVEDITRRKEAEEAVIKRADELARTTGILARTTASLKKRNEELDQFAYVVSHDLKAPLRAIANLSTWIEEDLRDHLSEETEHQMNLLRGRVHRMEALIEALLTYSRVGRIKTTSEIVNVEKLLADIIDSLAPPPEVHVEVGQGMPILVTQRLLLQQVFANLISNAIKHNHKSAGYVKISVKDQGDLYEFAVADDGPGIAPQYHEKVFIIFQTLEARDKVENTGIGLSLVKKIVETQGGTIQLESQEGQGATFRFTWPKHLNLT